MIKYLNQPLVKNYVSLLLVQGEFYIPSTGISSCGSEHRCQ